MIHVAHDLLLLVAGAAVTARPISASEPGRWHPLQTAVFVLGSCAVLWGLILCVLAALVRIL